MARILPLLLCLVLITSLFGCEASVQRSESKSPELLSDSSISDADVPWQDISGGIDLNDLEAVSRIFIDPLKPAGYPWFYSWNSIGQLDPEDYISILSYYNYLNLPLGMERYDDPYADADLVEADLCNRFGVNKETLRSSRFYDSESHTYLLLVGGGGPDRMVAASADKDGKQITIEVAYHYLSGDTVNPDLIGSFLPDNQQNASDYGYSRGFLFPFSALVVRLSEEENAFEYISYQLYNEAYARHDLTKVTSQQIKKPKTQAG